MLRIVSSVPDPEHIAAHMEKGEIDLLIDSERIVPNGMETRILLKQAFVMAQRKGHPRGTGVLDLDGYCQLRHVVASPERGIIRGYMDDYLESIGRQRNTVLSVPQFMMALEILRTSDHVATLPHMFLTRFADVVDVFELPFPSPEFTLTMAWHGMACARPCGPRSEVAARTDRWHRYGGGCVVRASADPISWQQFPPPCGKLKFLTGRR